MVKARTTKKPPASESHDITPAAPRLVAQHHGRKLVSFNAINGLDYVYLSKVVDAIEARTESLAFTTARLHARAAKAVLTFVSGCCTTEANVVIAALNSDSVHLIDASVVHAVELAYWCQLTERYSRGSSTLAIRIGDTNRVLSCLAARSLWPHTLGLTKERKDKDLSDVRPSLLESIGNSNSRAATLRGSEVRKAAALNGLQRLHVPIPEEDAEIPAALLHG